MEIRMDETSAMAHGETKVFDFVTGGKSKQGFLIRYNQGYYAYLNRCCHWPTPLDMGDGDFYAPNVDRIMCKTHGAIYQVDTGFCEMGPCVSAVLESFPLQLFSDYVLITVPD